MQKYLSTKETWDEFRKELSPRDLDIKPRSVGATKLALSKKFSKNNSPENPIFLKLKNEIIRFYEQHSYFESHSYNPNKLWHIKYIIPFSHCIWSTNV